MIGEAIIALLISILLPSLGKARDAARAAVCGSSERQLGVAIAAYASDSDDGQGYGDRNVGYKPMKTSPRGRYPMTSPARAASEPCQQYF